jgi:hypothetical protein
MSHRFRASGSTPSWSIAKTWPVAPPSGEAYDAAYTVRLTETASGATHDLVVEYAAPSALACVGYAEEIARRFLRQSDPPSHVIVDTERSVRVVADQPAEPGAAAERR